MVESRGAQIIDSGGEKEAWLEKIQFLSDAMESTSQPFCAADPDGSILVFNEAFCRLTGYTREELYNINWATDLTVAETSKNELKALKVLDQTHQPQRYEKSYRRKDGTVVPVELLVDLASDSKGRPLFYYAFITNITKRKQADKALRLAKFTLNNTSDEVFWIEPNGHIFDVNKAASAALEYTPEELRRMYVWEIDPDYTREVWPSHWQELKERRVLKFESTQRTKSGRTFPTEVTVNYIEFEGTEYNCGVVRDITERKQAEEAVLEREEIFHAMADSSYAAVLMHRGQNYIYVNTAASRITGYSIDQLLSMPFWCIVHPDMREQVKSRGMDRLHSKLQPGNYEVKLLAASGETRWALISSALFNYHGQPSILFTLVDITERKLADEALRESEAGLAKAQWIANIGSYSLDTRLDRARCSDEFYRILGITPLEVFSLQSFLNYVYPEDRDKLEHEYRGSIDQGRSYNGEFRIVRPDGEVRIIRGDGEPIIDESGCTVEMFGIIQDITERKQAEESLIESEEKFRVLAETAPVGIMLFRKDKYIYTNPFMQNILGYSEDELLALNFWDVIHPNFRELARARGRERLQGLSVPSRYELMVTTKGGETLWGDYSAEVIMYGGQPTVIGVYSDITERKWAEESLRESEERYRELVNMSPDAVLVHRGGIILYANAAAVRLHGATSIEQLLGRNILDFIRPDDRQMAIDRIREIEQGEDMPLEELKMIRLDGRPVDVETSARRIHYGGEPAIQAIVRDITQRKRAQTELREREENFRALAESSTAAIFVIQGEGYTTANQAAANITGYPKDELLKLNIIDIIHPDFKEIVRSRAHARQRGEPVIPVYETKIVTKRGEEKWVTISAARTIYRGQPAEVATLVDITERKLVEEDRKRLIRDLGKRVKELRALYKTYETIQAGGPVSETLEKIVNSLPLAWQYPEVTAARISMNDQEYKTPNFSKTQWVQQADFSTVDGQRGVIEVYYLKEKPNMTEGPFLSEERALINSLAKMLRVYLDKRYAEKALRKAKTQAELYLDLMGHDITNMNQALIGNLEMLDMLSETGEIDKGLITSSIETINRGSRTIRDVKKLTQIQTGKVPQKVVNVCEILSTVKSKYSEVPGRSVTINYAPGDNCLVQAGDMLEDVFDNLVDNAIRHSQGAVTIDLTVDQVIDKGIACLRIDVADTGPGIPDELKKTIFMTPEELEGKTIRRGFGLYLVRTLVDYYHGKVRAEDRVPGDYTKGARFVVLLPVAEK